MTEQFLKKISKSTPHFFTIDSFGLYSVTITARGDLRIEVDRIKLREIPPENKPQYNNIPPSWSDSKLQGKAKTIIFILKLNKGEHSIQFIPTGEASIEHFSVKEVIDFKNIRFELEKNAEDVDKRPWFTFALVNVPLKSISADITVGWHFFDGDDVKLIIDNKIKKNTSSILHKNWIWSASPLQKFTGSKREEKFFTENLSLGIHYVEFWADKTPTLHRIILNLGDFSLTRTPTVDDPEWTGNFADDTDSMILARVLFGEARNKLVPDKARIAIEWVIRNRVKDSRWANTYWEVITQPWQFSAFNHNDPNRKFVENPLHTKTRINEDAWKHAYEIAEEIINSDVQDISKGANHYYDDSISTPEWATGEDPIFKITYKNQYGKNATIFFFRL